VEKNAKSPSNQLRADRSIAETVSRNTENPGTNLINFLFFVDPAIEKDPSAGLSEYKKEITVNLPDLYLYHGNIMDRT
jgi:hypothetical protein